MAVLTIVPAAPAMTRMVALAVAPLLREPRLQITVPPALVALPCETVALETTLTPELRCEGLAREVIRLIQDARKSDGLDVTDRIALRWATAGVELCLERAPDARRDGAG